MERKEVSEMRVFTGVAWALPLGLLVWALVLWLLA